MHTFPIGNFRPLSSEVPILICTPVYLVHELGGPTEHPQTLREWYHFVQETRPNNILHVTIENVGMDSAYPPFSKMAANSELFSPITRCLRHIDHNSAVYTHVFRVKESNKNNKINNWSFCCGSHFEIQNGRQEKSFLLISQSLRFVET